MFDGAISTQPRRQGPSDLHLLAARGTMWSMDKSTLSAPTAPSQEGGLLLGNLGWGPQEQSGEAVTVGSG